MNLYGGLDVNLYVFYALHHVDYWWILNHVMLLGGLFVNFKSCDNIMSKCKNIMDYFC